MKRLSFAAVFALLVVLLALPGVASAKQTRAVPKNDDLASARPLKLGASAKVKNIGAATTEVDEPNHCYGGNNSVWFTFTPETYMTAYFSTSGTRLYAGLASTYDTTLALYSGDALDTVDTLTYEDCNDDGGSWYSELTVNLYPGETYYLRVSTYDDIDFDPQSVLALTSRITWADISPLNYSFEEPLGADNWKIKKGSGDDVVCSDATYWAASGSCAFKFVGGPDERSKLVQTYDVPAGMKLRKKGTFYSQMMARVMDVATLGAANVKIRLIYADGTPATVVTMNLKDMPSSDGYYYISGVSNFASTKLSKIKVQYNFKSTEGTLLIDGLWFEYAATANTRQPAGVLPLPPAAQ